MDDKTAKRKFVIYKAKVYFWRTLQVLVAFYFMLVLGIDDLLLSLR